jgi:3-oxoacyl-[acyl-carrier protein] reductase
MQNLKDRIALITGGGRGIGAAIALALAQAGAHIAVNYRQRADAAQSICGEISSLGRRALAVQADVSVAAEVTAMVQKVEQHLGSISILVNNAGVARIQTLEQVSEQDWDEVLATNLKSVFLVTQAVVGGMRRQGWGRIINLSSVAAHTGGVVGPHYAASKAGILGLTHFCASRFAREGITVNAIAPALVATDMLSHNTRATPDLIPMGRFGNVEEVASVAVMLATNGYLNGQTINVDGGWYMM